MINKRNVLGKTPDELGKKDAVHVAIVAVRAGAPIKPGRRIGLNENREAVPNSKGPGIADFSRKKTILRGQIFWMLLDQNEVPNVEHDWKHPTIDFSPPTNEVKKNETIQHCADLFGVTYEQVMEAASYVVRNNKPAPYPGPGTANDRPEVDENEFDSYDFWSEWSRETLHEFENYGSECCPEYEYPECSLFEKS